MFPLIRALTYASLIVALGLLLLPGDWLQWAGVIRPASVGPQQALGVLVAVLGLSVTLWCVLEFAVVGRGTPVPLDPPRRLVVRGPYRFVRNPMAIGLGTAILGVAVYYESWRLAALTATFFFTIHLLVVVYEEPTLRRSFGDQYAAYCDAVPRWCPRRTGYRP